MCGSKGLEICVLMAVYGVSNFYVLVTHKFLPVPFVFLCWDLGWACCFLGCMYAT